MFPELFKIPFTDVILPTYGVLLAVAFIAALWFSARLASQDGLEKNHVYDLGLYVLAAGLIGSKLLMVITEWDEFKGDWRRLVSLDFLRSGGVYYGGFLIAVAVSLLLVKKWKLPWLKTADAFAPSIAFGHFFGRLGCFSAGCCWGKETASLIGVTFPEKGNEVTGVPFGIPLVPTQLIEAGMNLLIFGALLILRKRRAFYGQVMFAYLLLYSVARFTIEFWRDDPRGSVLGLSTSQFISVLVFPAALGLMAYYGKKAKETKLASRPAAAAQPARDESDHKEHVLVPASGGEAENAESKPAPGGIA